MQNPKRTVASKTERIASTLENEIRLGRIGNGDLLASEAELGDRFSVSRNTIRKSLNILVEKDFITKKRGIGSFVTFGDELIDDRSGWSVALEANSMNVSTRVLKIMRGSMELADDTVVEGTDCLVVDRLRFLVSTGKGISLERSRMPWRPCFETVPEKGLVGGSLSKTFRALNLNIAGGSENVSVVKALTASDAEIMGRDAGEPVLRLRRRTMCDENSVLEVVESLLDPDYFAVRIDF